MAAVDKIITNLPNLPPYPTMLIDQPETLLEALNLIVNALKGITQTDVDMAASLALQENATAYTIASGAIDLEEGVGVALAHHSTIKVDTESGAGSDILHTINGGRDGMLLFLRAADDTHTIILEGGTGNLILGGDITLDTYDKLALLQYNDTLSKWLRFVPSPHSLLIDADGDTKVLVEESADEDIIRLYAAGTEIMTIGHEGAVDIFHTATAVNEHAIEIDVDAAGFGNVLGLNISYDTGGLAIGSDQAVLLISVDESDASGGDIFGVQVLATEGSASVFALHAGAVVHPIEHLSGTFANMDSALVKAVDRLTEFTTSDPGGANNVEIFVAQNDTITIGDANKFEELEFLFETVASGAGIKPAFEYSTGVGTWATFSPTDGTQGMRHSGAIAWVDTDIPSWAVGTGSEYLIRITRTRVNLTTVPKEDKVQIAAVTIYSWDKDGNIVVNSITADTIDETTASGGVGTTSLWTFNPSGAGGVTDYDIQIGDTDGAPTYGIARLGDSIMGRTSYKAGSIDLDGTVIFRNVGGPVTGQVEFVWVESGGTSTRFALAKPGVGNATYNSRSMLIAGPAPADTDFVKVSYWQGQGIFDNLACDTAGDGADLGVQNDLEVEGDIFTDSILESTATAGVTVDGVELKDGLVDGVDVAARDHAKYTDAEAITAVEGEATLDLTGVLTVAGDSVTIKTSQSPASGGAGVQGEFAWDASYFYVCTATNTWARVALTGGY